MHRSPRHGYVFAALLLLLGRAEPATAQWLPDGLPVCAAPGDQRAPVIALDLEGQAIVAWEDHRGPQSGADIYAQRYLWGEISPGWPLNGLPICGVREDQRNPWLIPDKTGGFYVAWEDFRNGNWDIYARRMLGSGLSAPGWPDTGFAVCKAVGNQTGLVAVADGIGGVYVAWKDLRENVDAIYARRLTPVGGAIGWGTTGRRIAELQAWNPAVASDGLGNAYFSWNSRWVDGQFGTDAVFVSHVDTLGATRPGWPLTGLRVFADAQGRAQVEPTVTARPSGGVFVTWQDTLGVCSSCSPLADLHGEGIGEDGVPDWGATVCAAPGRQANAIAVADADVGGALAWEDQRTGTAQVYSSWFTNASPAPQDGLAVAPGVLAQEDPSLARDREGGVYITWRQPGVPVGEIETGTIHVQRVSSFNGVPAGWPSGGVLLSAAPTQKVHPRVVTDLGRGALVVWQERRDGQEDIYLQRVGPGGELASTVGVEELGAAGAAWVEVFPNPLKSACTIRYAPGPLATASILIQDVRGRTVRRLSAADSGGEVRSLRWDRRDQRGRPVSAGIYFVRLDGSDQRTEKKLVVLPGSPE